MNDFTLLLLSLSLSGTIIAGLCFAVKAIWRKKLSKSVLYYLWLIALVRLVLPFSFEGALLNRIYEGNKQTAASTVSIESTTKISTVQTAVSIPTATALNSEQYVETVSSPAAVSVITPAADPADMPVMAPTITTSSKSFSFATFIFYLWIAGFTAFCVFTLTSYGRFIAKLKKANRQADENVLQIGKQFGCKIKIYQNPLAKTPMLIGFFRQSIILPNIIFSEDELRGAIVHELTHKLRHDLLYKWFAMFANAIHWFNPAAWLIRLEVSRACELSCDETIIKNLEAKEKQTYGETLINLAAAHRYPAGVIATTLCEEMQTLKERLGAIMTYRKKGLWNKILGCVLILAIAASGTFLGACGTIATSLPKDLFGKTINYPKVLNLLSPYFFSDSDATTAAMKQEWLEQMSARYGVELNFVSNEYQDGTLTNSVNTQMRDVINGRSSFAGMVTVTSCEMLNNAVKNGVAVPLENYLADNPVWNALPEEIKSMYTIDGHIYAIPSSCTWMMKARFIAPDSLTQTGIEVTDLHSFREYALALMKTGKYQYVLGSEVLAGVGDILNAYGLYAGTYDSFSYDPVEDCIVDFLTKGEAVTALEYLRELYTAGALKINFDNNGQNAQDFNNGVCASRYAYNLQGESGNPLWMLNLSYPQIPQCLMQGYIMTKGTPEPKETVNFFVNMLFGSEQNYLDCSLGLSDNYILNGDGSITMKLKVTEDGLPVNFAMPNLVGTLPGVLYSEHKIKYEFNSTPKPVYAEMFENVNQSNAAVDNAVKKGLVRKVPAAYTQIHISEFYENKSDIESLYLTCIQDAITATDWTVQQIVDEYKEKMLNMGGNAMLDEMNAAIGKKTAYYYG